MNLLTILLLAGGTTGFFYMMRGEHLRLHQIHARRASVHRRRLVKLAELTRRRRGRTRLESGTEGPDARAAARMLAQMMGGEVVDRPPLVPPGPDDADPPAEP